MDKDRPANTRDEVTERFNAPTYEAEVRSMATFLEKKADGFADMPAVLVQVSPECARWIAKILRNHADDVEITKG